MRQRLAIEAAVGEGGAADLAVMEGLLEHAAIHQMLEVLAHRYPRHAGVLAQRLGGERFAVLFGGAVADLIPQQRILLTIELTKSLVAGAIAALALTGTLQIWHLAVVGFVLGVADGFFYPAYSALLPAILPADDLLAANGVEGTLRPTIMQAAGPALAGAVIAAASPALAFVVVAAAQFAGALVLTRLRPTPLRRSEPEPGDEVALAADAPAPPSARSAVGSLLRDIAEGFRYMVRTPWLLATLVFASLLVLVIMGPIEVRTRPGSLVDAAYPTAVAAGPGLREGATTERARKGRDDLGVALNH